MSGRAEEVTEPLTDSRHNGQVDSITGIAQIHEEVKRFSQIICHLGGLGAKCARAGDGDISTLPLNSDQWPNLPPRWPDERGEQHDSQLRNGKVLHFISSRALLLLTLPRIELEVRQDVQGCKIKDCRSTLYAYSL